MAEGDFDGLRGGDGGDERRFLGELEVESWVGLGEAGEESGELGGGFEGVDGQVGGVGFGGHECLFQCKRDYWIYLDSFQELIGQGNGKFRIGGRVG